MRRGGRGGPHDTRATLLRIAGLRAQRAALLGFADHASWVVRTRRPETWRRPSGCCAGWPRRPSRTRGRGGRTHRAPARRRVRRAAGTLGLGLLRRTPAPGAVRRRHRGPAAVVRARTRPRRRGLRHGHRPLRPDVHRAHGRPGVLGRRASVRGRRRLRPAGALPLRPLRPAVQARRAWMSSFVEQSRLLGERPVVVNCLNVAKPAAGDPALLTVDEVETLFHEFGTRCTACCPTCTYPRSPGRACRATSSSSPPRSTSSGFRTRGAGPLRPPRHDGEPPARGRRRPGCAPPARTARGSARPSTSPRRCSTWPGTGWRPVPSTTPGPTTSAASRPPRWPRPGSRSTPSRRATAAPTSTTCSAAVRGRLLLLRVERGARRRHRRVVRRERRPAARERRPVPRHRALARGSVDPLAAYREFRGRDARIEPLLRRRQLAEV